MGRKSVLLLSSMALIGASVTRARTDVEPKAAPLVEGKRVAAPWWELALTFDRSVADKYVEHAGLHVGVTAYFTDHLALDVQTGALLGRQGETLALIQDMGGHGPGAEPALPDQWQTTWFASAGAQWAPLYGKLSLAGELELDLQVFAVAAVGAEGIRRRLRDDTYDEPRVPRPFVEYGVGVRLFPARWLALRLELRGRDGMNPPVAELDATGADPCPGGYALEVRGVDECRTDFGHLSLLQLGIGFSF